MADRLKLLASEQEILTANAAGKAKLLLKVGRPVGCMVSSVTIQET